MKIKPALISFFVFFLIITSIVRAQNPIDNIINALGKHTADRPQEKVHLHFDKQNYAVGDTIWFKAYVVTSSNNLPTNLSNTLNVDVFNENDSVVFSRKVQLLGGLGNGSINLPFSLKGGNYTISSYTTWMQNFNVDYFFKKIIRIENPYLNEIANGKTIINSAASDFNLFPEGGDLVAGIRSKVAFKYVDANGIGKNISGYVVNKANEKITTFQSSHAGMGIFAIIPVVNESYTAILEDGSQKKINFPAIKDVGYMLSVNNLDTANLLVKIAISPSLVNDKEVTLIAQGNGLVKYGAKIKPKEAITVLIPKSEFSTGILHLTLFTSEMLPVAERLVFINHKDQIKFNIIADKPFYNKKDNVKLTLDLSNNGKETPIGSYSLTVIDESKVAFNQDTDLSIVANLLLTSDLKGRVEKPGYYFNAENVDAAKYLDYLMLTQGWRRFKWNEVLTQSQTPLLHKPEKGITISGIITTLGGKPIAGASIKLLSSKSLFTMDTLANEQGRFSFRGIVFSDSASFILVGKNKESKNVKIILDKTVSPIFKATSNNIKIDVDMEKYLANIKKQYEEEYTIYRNSKALLLKAVEIKGQAKQVAGLERSANLNGAGNADKVISGELLEHETDLFSYLEKNAVGITKADDTMMLSRNVNSLMPNSAEKPAAIQFYLDGNPISQDFILNMPVDEIALVEVLKNAALTTIYGASGYGGVILVSSKRGRSNIVRSADGVITFIARGYDITKEFYSPKYTATNTAQKADLRSTIYWNPNLIVDKEGKIHLNFYNSDAMGNYKVIIEGVNADGKVGRSIFTYAVK